MKIKTKKLSYDEVMAKPLWKHKKPIKQSSFWRFVLRMASRGELKATDFTCERMGMERLGKKEPCLFLMNHSSFTDLQIASELLYDRQFHIVCTNDGFVGKEGLMRRIGCIPTKKFIMDMQLVKDMKYTFEKLKSSILMYPEASYSFDGTETPLPDSLGKCVKLMKVPVVMIRTKGAFLRDPLYNCLNKRDVKVSAYMKYLLSAEECEKLSAEEITEAIRKEFSYDHFKEQKADGIRVKEPFRALGLHRALYCCPHCLTEGNTVGEGINLTCNSCGEVYELSEEGTLFRDSKSSVSEGEDFTYVSDWYAWQRGRVRKEIEDGSYSYDADVDIRMLVDSEAVYEVGEGHLHHDENGFRLTGCDGKLDFTMKPSESYSLYADYFWYDLGDMICIGNNKRQYYCFPKEGQNRNVAKVRLATEEIFKRLNSAKKMQNRG